jgi:hypothetical protein
LQKRNKTKKIKIKTETKEFKSPVTAYAVIEQAGDKTIINI